MNTEDRPAPGDNQDSMQIPLDTNQQLMQCIFQLFMVCLFSGYYWRWHKQAKYDTNIKKFVTHAYFISRILSDFVCFVAIGAVYICQMICIIEEINPKDIEVVNTAISIVHFIFGKTVPSMMMVMMMLISVSVFICPLKVSVSIKVMCVIVAALVIAQASIAALIPEAIMVLDFTQIGLNIVLTAVQCTLLYIKMIKQKALLFREQQEEHAKTMYAALCYDVSIIIMTYFNIVQLVYDYNNLCQKWFYWAFQDAYQILGAIPQIYAVFPPQWLITRFKSQSVMDQLNIVDDWLQQQELYE